MSAPGILTWYDFNTDKCVEQPKCKKGFKLTGKFADKKADCVACDAGTYQSEADFQSDKCQGHVTCRKGAHSVPLRLPRWRERERARAHERAKLVLRIGRMQYELVVCTTS